MGKKPFEAALDGTREVSMPILVSTITFCVVFYPVVFLSGLAKFLFTPLAVAASVAIFASYLIAMTLVPAYCARFFTAGSARQESTEDGHGRLAAAFGGILEKVLAVRYLVVLASVALFAGAVLLLSTMGQELFPPVDAGQFTLYVRMPSGTRIERTERTIAGIEQVLIDRLGEPDPAFALGTEERPESSLQILISNIGVLMDWPAAEALPLNFRGIRGGTLRAIEAQQAIAALASARDRYLSSVIDHNQAQFQLLRSLGQPPHVIDASTP